jgi:hypothetical protein
MSARTMTMTRRFCLSRLLLAAAVAPMAGLSVAAPVGADKKKNVKGSVAERAKSQQQLCELGGGKLAVLDGPNGGNTTECKGGDNDGWTCFNTTTTTDCSKQQPADDGNPALGGVDPSDLPGHPLEPNASPLDAPGHVSDQPLEPDGGAITLYAADHMTSRKGSRHGAHKRGSRGKGRAVGNRRSRGMARSRRTTRGGQIRTAAPLERRPTEDPCPPMDQPFATRKGVVGTDSSKGMRIGALPRAVRLGRFMEMGWSRTVR